MQGNPFSFVSKYVFNNQRLDLPFNIQSANHISFVNSSSLTYLTTGMRIGPLQVCILVVSLFPEVNA